MIHTGYKKCLGINLNKEKDLNNEDYQILIKINHQEYKNLKDVAWI